VTWTQPLHNSYRLPHQLYIKHKTTKAEDCLRFGIKHRYCSQSYHLYYPLVWSTTPAISPVKIRQWDNVLMLIKIIHTGTYFKVRVSHFIHLITFHKTFFTTIFLMFIILLQQCMFLSGWIYYDYMTFYSDIPLELNSMLKYTHNFLLLHEPWRYYDAERNDKGKILQKLESPA
jgi:hypothetical protein